MKKVQNITVVSLSAGTIGEDFVAHEIRRGTARLREFGLSVKFSEHAMMGREYIAAHPEARAADLLSALEDPDCDMILCAIGGEDTYRLLPYLFENGAPKPADKIFLGYSDTTANHFMLHKIGMKTFYGQSFLSDICELAPTMFPYSEKYFRELCETGGIREIRPSDVWYEERTTYSEAATDTVPPMHKNEGFLLLQGKPTFSGKILGGCLDTIYDFFDGTRFADTVALCEKYHLFPDAEEWRGRILLLETSEERMSPEKFRQGLLFLKERGVFGAVNGILFGKPANEVYRDEYHKILVETVGDPDLPILANINVGHAQPHCIIPFGVDAEVNAPAQTIRFV